jgi:glycosyltransferase involved in cell wall biosynthesis
VDAPYHAAAMTTSQPLVSILIPTHERPDYLRQALQSAQAQTYEQLDIVISDNGPSDTSWLALKEQVASDPRVRYLRCPERTHYLDNWLHALSHARGPYIGFLMDDDLFAPNKLERMLPLLAHNSEVGLVTSHRALIDANGNPLPPVVETQPMFGQDVVVDGIALGNRVLSMGANVIGEPTTVLMRRDDLGASFGNLYGHQYQVLTDVATWLRLMQGRKAVVLQESLSSFRLHGGQDQRRGLQQVAANVEWLRLLLDCYDAGHYLRDHALFLRILRAQVESTLPFITQKLDTLRDSAFDVAPLQDLTHRALDRMFRV